MRSVCFVPPSCSPEVADGTSTPCFVRTHLSHHARRFQEASRNRLCPVLITDDPPAFPVVGDAAAVTVTGAGAGAGARPRALLPPVPTISVHETGGLHVIRSTWLRRNKLRPETSELTTEVFLSRDLIDSATGGLPDVDGLKYLRYSPCLYHHPHT